MSDMSKKILIGIKQQRFNAYHTVTTLSILVLITVELYFSYLLCFVVWECAKSLYALLTPVTLIIFI